MDQEFIVRMPTDGAHRTYGPYLCSEDSEIANHILKLSEGEYLRIPNTPFQVKHPRHLSVHILVVTYPQSCRAFPEPEPVTVYGIECGPNERLSEEEIKNRLIDTYKVDVIEDRCFCVYSEPTQSPNEVDLFSNLRKYGRGTIFIAKNYDYNSDSSSPPSDSLMFRNIAPPTNLPLPRQNSESHAQTGPIVATSESGPPKSSQFIMPNQNRVLPSSPSQNDDTRKVLTHVDGPTQVLVADLPHLEQKTPLQNLGQLAGSTALQGVLVTPSGERDELGGPVPCKDKPPTIVINITGEEREGGDEREEEEIVKPQSESSTSVSAPKSAGGSLLEPLHRQRSLSGGDDMVAPKLQKSHRGMVTGRTISLPPKEQLSKSTENLCTGNSSSIIRTQSDLSDQRKRGDLNLLLNCGVTYTPSDNSEGGGEQPKMRRRSMSDLGAQRQNSGGDRNEAVIAGIGLPKSLLVQNENRSRLTSTIHEHDGEEESVVSKQGIQAEVSTDQNRSGPPAKTSSPEERPPLFRIESIDKTSGQEDDEPDELEEELGQGRNGEHSSLEQEADGMEQPVKGRERRELTSRGCPTSSEKSSVLPQREIQQQVHIMEHVYNGKCVLEDGCPRPPSAEGLRQMSGIIDAHRRGVLNTEWTGLFKSYIRAHCSRCRDGGCKVPHMAVGCPQPGTVQSYGSSSGSSFVALTHSSDESVAQNPHQDEAPHCQQQRFRSTSVDLVAAYESTSDEVRAFNCHQVADSVHPLGQRGANQTDNPPSSRLDGCFAPMNGTPPDDVNPMVYALSNFRPRPSVLPGVGQTQAKVPIAATTNEAGNKGLTRNEFRGRLMDSLCSPIQQVSDADHAGGLNRHQACYIQPTRKVKNYCQNGGHFSPSELPDVRVDGFPHSSKYSNIDEGVLIYCSERLTSDTGFFLGAKGHPPNQQKADVLGRGGNGSVYGDYQNGREFAVKQTTYRRTELQAWLRLDHPNVLPLLGVMWGGHKDLGGHYCYQFMPKMTSDLSSVMRSVGDLYTLVRFETRDQWERVVRPNVCHVVKSLVSGVKYLHDMGIQHYDLKASNILINRAPTCQCADIFCCDCPPGSKCEIRIADFDSVKMFTPGRCAASVPDVPCEPKPSDAKVLGTPFYRAPEQFKQQSRRSGGAAQRTTWSQQQCNVEGLEGPWCDMWAVGIIITQLCLGKQRTKEREKVCRTMVTTPTTIPSTSNPTPEVEGFVARERLSTLRAKCIDCKQLAPLAEIAALCLEPNFKERITAEVLLQNDFFLQM